MMFKRLKSWLSSYKCPSCHLKVDLSVLEPIDKDDYSVTYRCPNCEEDIII